MTFKFTATRYSYTAIEYPPLYHYVHNLAPVRLCRMQTLYGFTLNISL